MEKIIDYNLETEEKELNEVREVKKNTKENKPKKGQVSNLRVRLIAFTTALAVTGFGIYTFFQINKNAPKKYSQAAVQLLDEIDDKTMLDEVITYLNNQEESELKTSDISVADIDRIESLVALSDRLADLKLDEYTEGLIESEIPEEYDLAEIESKVESFEEASKNITNPNVLSSEARALISDALLLEAYSRAIEKELYYDSYGKLVDLAETILKVKIGDACGLTIEEVNNIEIEKNNKGLVTGEYYFKDPNGKTYNLDYCDGAMIYSQRGYGQTIENTVNKIITMSDKREQEKNNNEQTGTVNLSALTHNSDRNKELSSICSELKSAIGSVFKNDNNTMKCTGFCEIEEPVETTAYVKTK